MTADCLVCVSPWQISHFLFIYIHSNYLDDNRDISLLVHLSHHAFYKEVAAGTPLSLLNLGHCFYSSFLQFSSVDHVTEVCGVLTGLAVLERLWSSAHKLWAGIKERIPIWARIQYSPHRDIFNITCQFLFLWIVNKHAYPGITWREPIVTLYLLL